MKRRDYYVPAIVLDRASATSLHLQIHKQIAQAILSGSVCNGAWLPSTRLLSRLLRVSRNTVLTAYDELAAGGLIVGRRGSGMRVNAPASSSGGILSGLRKVIDSAHYPTRTVLFEDPDGNELYFRV